MDNDSRGKMPPNGMVNDVFSHPPYMVTDFANFSASPPPYQFPGGKLSKPSPTGETLVQPPIMTTATGFPAPFNQQQIPNFIGSLSHPTISNQAQFFDQLCRNPWLQLQAHLKQQPIWLLGNQVNSRHQFPLSAPHHLFNQSQQIDPLLRNYWQSIFGQPNLPTTTTTKVNSSTTNPATSQQPKRKSLQPSMGSVLPKGNPSKIIEQMIMTCQMPIKSMSTSVLDKIETITTNNNDDNSEQPSSSSDFPSTSGSTKLSPTTNAMTTTPDSSSSSGRLSATALPVNLSFTMHKTTSRQMSSPQNSDTSTTSSVPMSSSPVSSKSLPPIGGKGPDDEKGRKNKFLVDDILSLGRKST